MEVIDGGKPLDRRRNPRRRGLLKGRLIHSADRCVVTCSIRSLSLSGAAIRVPPFTQIGEPVFLLDLTNRLGFAARVVWRKEEITGLEFTSHFELGPPGDGLPDEAEIDEAISRASAS
jgi:hypothetical protein